MKAKVETIIDDNIMDVVCVRKTFNIETLQSVCSYFKRKNSLRTLYIPGKKLRQNPYPSLGLRPLKSLRKSVDLLPRLGKHTRSCI